MIDIIYIIFTISLLWYITPHIVLHLYPIPKLKTHWEFIKLSGKSLVILIPAMLAPIVVPIALLFTPWEADKLPKIFAIWDNDVSINGDNAADWGLDNFNNAYYAKSPPRSFWARYIWLGWRNRCSRLVEVLGYKYLPEEFNSRIIQGDPETSRSHAGWKYTYTNNISQLMIVKRVFRNWCLRFNWGYKFFNKPKTPFATITISILSYKG